MPSLGSLANAARGGSPGYPYKMVFPAIIICLIVLSFNLLGDGLRRLRPEAEEVTDYE